MPIILVASDFSFAERAVIDVWIWLWFIHRVWSTDKFASLQWHKIYNFDLKSIITLLIFLMLPVEALFDIVWTYLKYREGYVIDNNNIYTKPTYSVDGTLIWMKEDELLKIITEFMLAVCFAFQIGTLALMQAFWSHLSSQMGGKPFMRTWKFRFYVGWVFASMIIFPLARILTNLPNENKLLVETVPQTIFSTQMFIIFLLGIKNGRKLNNLLNSIQHTRSPSGHETILRIRYFIDMNECLMIGALFISGGILIIILSVAFTGHIASKFFLDTLIIHVNLGGLILWATMILIIYPRYYITGTSGAVLNNNSTNTPQTPRALDVRHASLDPTNNRYMINLNTTTTTTVTSITPHQPSSPSKASQYSVERSINSLLEEQNQQIEIFRHKASASISSTITTVTTASYHAPATPLIPPPPLTPPSTARENPYHDIEIQT